MSGERKLCVHCKKNKACRPRQTCFTCYYRPGVRDLYPSTSKYARRGVGNGGSGDLPEPTDTPPLSLARLKVLAARAKLGLALHHPADNRVVDWSAAHPFSAPGVPTYEGGDGPTGLED